MSELKAQMIEDAKESLHAWAEVEGGSFAYVHTANGDLIAQHYTDDGEVDVAWKLTFTARKVAA